jgi:hypothetical protein
MTGTSPNIVFRRLLMTVACVGLILTAGAGRTYLSASAAEGGDDGDRSGPIHIRKNCSAYTGLAGGFCTITESNVAAIPPGSLVHYSQAFGILNPAWLDSNVVLDAGNGNKAVGRCTVDFSTATPGVCLFFNGTGDLAGFTARVDVTTVPVPPADYFWDGSYRFVLGPER